MIINKNEVDIDRAMKIADIDNVILKRRDGKLPSLTLVKTKYHFKYYKYLFFLLFFTCV